MDHLVRLGALGTGGLGRHAAAPGDGPVPGPGLAAHHHGRLHLPSQNRPARFGDQPLLEDADVGAHRVHGPACSQPQAFGQDGAGIAATPGALGYPDPANLGGQLNTRRPTRPGRIVERADQRPLHPPDGVRRLVIARSTDGRRHSHDGGCGRKARFDRVVHRLSLWPGRPPLP